MLEDEVLKSFLKKIKEEFKGHLQKVILFGSRSRNDFSSESDYDLLLIFNEISKKGRDFIEDLACNILIEHGRLFSIFILDQRQFNQMKFEPFIINAQREGVSL